MILIFFVYFLTFLTFVLSEQKLDYTNQENYDIWIGMCNSKTSQSPIDLPDNDDCIQSTDYVQILSTNYPLINDKNVSFVHGYSFAIEFGDEGKQALTVKINETTLVYDLKNIHFHFESEHKIEGELLPAEIHFVHDLHKDQQLRNIEEGEIGETDSNEHLVVGIFYDTNDDSDDEYEDSFISAIDFVNQKNISNLNFSSFISNNKDFYYYHGSLTTPPCTENVNWIIMKDKYEMSLEQFEQYKTYIETQYTGGNHRKTFPVNNRDIYFINNDKDNTDSDADSKSVQSSKYLIISYYLLLLIFFAV